MNRRNRRILADGLAALELDMDSGPIDLLVRYCDEIALWNRRMNLVGGSERDIVIRHILDSLAPVRIFSELSDGSLANRSVADVGSGAGLPGIPLAIALPDTEITLIERSTRRAAFLTTIRLLLKLSNVTVAEEGSETHRRVYDLVLCRAFLPFEKALPLLAPLVGPNGAIGFYAAEPPAVSSVPGFSRVDYELDVPFLEGRRTLISLQRFEL